MLRGELNVNFLTEGIVNRGNGFEAGKHQISKQTGQDLCWKVLVPAHVLFYAH